MSSLMYLQKLQRLAGGRTRDDYPESEKLLDLCRDEVSALLASNPAPAPSHFVAAVLAGITAADVQGFISIGDEHEWAVLSLMATERAWKGK